MQRTLLTPLAALRAPQALTLKNKELIKKLKTLCPDDGSKLTAAALQSRGLQSNVERFLFQLALAEKLA